VLALTSVETAGLSLLVVIIIGTALGYWFFGFVGRLGGRLLGREPQMRVPAARTTVRRPFAYEAFSWFFSIVASIAVIAIVGTFTNQYLNNADTGSVEVLVLVLLIGVWVWFWRRFHTPPFHFIPKRDYEQFVEWRDRDGG
jgi:hypothetical protein